MQEIARACSRAPVLDLACGTGRNGLFLLASDIPVVFADRDSQSLEQIKQHLSDQPCERQQALARLWQVDLEIPHTHPLDAETFGAILVFRYLHRPLLAGIKDAVIPGGLVIYETFTVEQAAIGRPRNPDFLLRPGELRDCFREWDILHDFEGIEHDPASGQPRAIARLVAEKPVA
jgi:SAM-dependent methyltransferase